MGTRTEYKRLWRHTHPQSCKASKVKYKLTHAEHIKSHLSEYCKLHQATDAHYRLIKNACNQKRKALIYTSKIEKVSFEQIKIRDKMICGICKRKVKETDLSFDHIIPLAMGGTHTENNIQVAHINCNRRKGIGKLPSQIRMLLKGV